MILAISQIVFDRRAVNGNFTCAFSDVKTLECGEDFEEDESFV